MKLALPLAILLLLLSIAACAVETADTGFQNPERPPQLQGSETFVIPAGDQETHRIRIPAAGYLNFRYNSVKHNNESQELDIGFELNSSNGNRISHAKIRHSDSIYVSEGDVVTFTFDNSYSLFAGKKVYLTYSLEY